MKISCQQFEELIPFYLNDELSEKLKNAFVEHLHNCPNCHIKFNMLNSIVSDIKDAYNQFIFENDKDIIDIVGEEIQDETTEINNILSAYIDNELNDETSVKIRQKIIAKPSIRKKLEKLYDIRKMMTDSFNDEKNRFRFDFSKSVIKRLQEKNNDKEGYMPCILFISFVISMLIVSFIIVRSLLTID